MRVRPERGDRGPERDGSGWARERGGDRRDDRSFERTDGRGYERDERGYERGPPSSYPERSHDGRGGPIRSHSYPERDVRPPVECRMGRAYSVEGFGKGEGYGKGGTDRRELGREPGREMGRGCVVDRQWSSDRSAPPPQRGFSDSRHEGGRQTHKPHAGPSHTGPQHSGPVEDNNYGSYGCSPLTPSQLPHAGSYTIPDGSRSHSFNPHGMSHGQPPSLERVGSDSGGLDRVGLPGPSRSSLLLQGSCASQQAHYQPHQPPHSSRFGHSMDSTGHFSAGAPNLHSVHMSQLQANNQLLGPVPVPVPVPVPTPQGQGGVQGNVIPACGTSRFQRSLERVDSGFTSSTPASCPRSLSQQNNDSFSAYANGGSSKVMALSSPTMSGMHGSGMQGSGTPAGRHGVNGWDGISQSGMAQIGVTQAGMAATPQTPARRELSEGELQERELARLEGELLLLSQQNCGLAYRSAELAAMVAKQQRDLNRKDILRGALAAERERLERHGSLPPPRLSDLHQAAHHQSCVRVAASAGSH